MVVQQPATTRRVVKLTLRVLVQETLRYLSTVCGLEATSVCEPTLRNLRLKFLSLTSSRAMDDPLPANVYLSADETVARAILGQVLSQKIGENEVSTCQQVIGEALDIILESCLEPLARHSLHLGLCQSRASQEQQAPADSLIAAHSCLACPIDTTAGKALVLFAPIQSVVGPDQWKVAKPAVLVVDDSTIGRKIIRKLLEDVGCEVVGEATNGIEAIQVYRACRPELVTMDITMPKMDGLRAARQILTNWPDANIVMLTSMHSDTAVATAYDHGVRHYILKPFSPDTILRKITEILGPPAGCLGACPKA